jgi:hypothetical protein
MGSDMSGDWVYPEVKMSDAEWLQAIKQRPWNVDGNAYAAHVNDDAVSALTRTVLALIARVDALEGAAPE